VIVLGIQICSSSLYFFNRTAKTIYMHIYFVLLVVVNSASVLVFFIGFSLFLACNYFWSTRVLSLLPGLDVFAT
jgi:hypothetical protein